MATVEQCQQAVEALAASLKPQQGRGEGLSRTLSCTVPDLDVVFSGRLHDGAVEGLTTAPAPKAQVRLTANSDDLVALSTGALDGGTALKSKRLKVSASLGDMLKLRSLL